jgi:CHAT domain-containing protein/tetratricopeptide (TPR) repeat protein
MGELPAVNELPAEVTAAVGSAVLGEDLCADLDRARASLEGLPDDALARAVVEVLSGRPADALARLVDGARSTPTVPGDVLATRRSVWRQHAHDRCEYVLPGGGAAFGVEFTARWGPHTAAAGGVEGPDHGGDADPAGRGVGSDWFDADEVRDPAAARVALEHLFVTEIEPLLRFARAWVHGFPLEHRTDVVDHLLQATERLRSVAEAAGDDATVAASRRLRAEVLMRGGRNDEAAEMLARARRDADERDDEVSRAAVALLTGDLAMSPLSHPYAGGGVLQDPGTWTSASPWPLEQREGDLRLVDTAAIEAAYAEAAGAYERVGAIRGSAAVDIRRAVLARLGGDAQTALQAAERAARSAADAGDLWLQRTAELEVLAGAIAAGRPTAGSDLPETIGAWGAGSGSFAYAFGLGLSLVRTGRQWLVRHGDPDRAAEAHRLAGRLFAALDAPTQVSQCLADEAAVSAAVQDLPAAIERYEGALVGHLERLTDPVRGGDAWSRGAGLALELHRIAVALEEPEVLRRSIERLRRLHAASPADPDADPVGLRHALEVTADDAEVLVLLAESDLAKDAGHVARAQEHAAAAADLAGSRDAHLLRAVSLRRLGRDADAADAFRAYQADAAAREAAFLEVYGDDLTADQRAALDGTRLRLREAAAFYTRLGDAEAALASFDELERQEPDWPSNEVRPWELLGDHGHALALAGDRERAAEVHATAIESLAARATRVARDEQRISLNADSARVFGRAAANLLGPPPLTPMAGERAFELVEQGRARSLADLLAVVHGTAGGAAGGDAAREAMRRWAAASAQLSLWQQLAANARRGPGADPEWLRELGVLEEQARHELASATDTLRTVNPGAADVVTADAAVSVAAVADRLSPGSALVSYLVVDDALLVFAVTPDGLAVAQRLPEVGTDLTRSLRAFSDGCATGEAWTAPGRAAAEVLLAPVADVVAGVERLYLVPTGIGHAAPLHALPWDDALLQDHVTLSVLPSAATLRYLPPLAGLGVADQAGGGTDAGGVLVVGDPEQMVLTTLSGDQVNQEPLPAARWEAQAVAAHLAAATDTGTVAAPIVGAAATAAAVREGLTAASIAHLATHVHVEIAAPLSSAILLAGRTSLTLADLVGLRLPCQLVVLSACNSGRGATTGGDEVLSMTRGLLGAGAASVVVSLWPVRDVSTAVLMARFAEHLANGADPARSLQLAQQWYRGLDEPGRREALDAVSQGAPPPSADIDRGGLSSGIVDIPAAHPYHWAAFTYVGAHPAT